MRRGGSGRLCLPDAPARPERGCGRSRGEGQSLCRSCRWLVSSPRAPPGRPRAAPAAGALPEPSPRSAARCGHSWAGGEGLPAAGGPRSVSPPYTPGDHIPAASSPGALGAGRDA